MFRLLNPRFLMEHPKFARVVLVVFLFGFTFIFYNSRLERGICEEACIQEEYASFRYVGGDRGKAPRCYCLTEEELLETDVIPKGTKIDFLPEEIEEE